MDKITKTKTVKAILKDGIFALLYTFLMCPTGLLILLIPQKYPYLIALASVVNLSFFALMCFFFYRGSGMEQMKTLHANQVLYKNKEHLSEGMRIETEKEFSAYKGFIYGLISVIPLLIFLIIYAVMDIAGVPLTAIQTSTNEAGEVITETVAGPLGAFGGVFKFIYALYWTFFATFGTETSVYFMLFAIPFAMAATGVGYVFGGMKAQKQINAIKETESVIYGGNKLEAQRALAEKNKKLQPKHIMGKKKK